MGPKMEISVSLVVPYNYKQSDYFNHYPLETLFINMVTLSFAAGSGGMRRQTYVKYT